jgi:hypothetical protein
MRGIRGSIGFPFDMLSILCIVASFKSITMYKTIFVTFALAASVLSYGQEAVIERNEAGLAEFQEIIKVDSISQKELFQRAYLWVANTYKNPDKVITSKVEPKMITGNGLNQGAFKHALVRHDVSYLFKIEVKANRVRLTVNNFKSDNYAAESYLYKNNGKERTNGQAKAYKQGFRKTALELKSSLKSALQKSDESDSDW